MITYYDGFAVEGEKTRHSERMLARWIALEKQKARLRLALLVSPLVLIAAGGVVAVWIGTAV